MRLALAALLALALFSCGAAPALADTPPPPSATAQVINHAIDKASDGLSQIAHALSSAAPQAFALAVKGIHAQGMSSLIVGGACFAVFLILLAYASCACTSGAARLNKNDEDGIGWFYMISGIVAVVFSVFFLIGACVNGLSGDSWAKVLAPDGYLAQQILSKALN